MKNNRNKKILQFPAPPKESELTTMTVQIGNERFAIHYEVEDLPPAPTLLRKPAVRKSTLEIVK